MAIKFNKELSLGQIVSITIFIFGVVGGAYALNSRVADLEKHQEKNVAREEFVLIQEDIKNMAQDIRDIRNALLDQLGKQANSTSPSSRSNASQNGVAGQPRQRGPNPDYPDSTYDGGAR